MDRSGSVDLSFQLAAALKAMLETEARAPGTRFASERELEKQFNVSRTVVRSALELLVGDGAIVRIKGVGAFVAEPRREIEVMGLLRALHDSPENLTLTVLTASEQLPDSAIAHFLEMEHQPTPVAHVTAVISIDGQPIGLLDSCSSTALVPWVLPTVEALQGKGSSAKPGKLKLGRPKVVIEHTFFGEWGGPKLGAPAGDPALMGRLIQYGRVRGAKRERPLEVARLVYRSDNTQLAVESA